MTWELADAKHPRRAGPRFPNLQDAADKLDRAMPRGRWFLRWVGPTVDMKQTPTTKESGKHDPR